MSGRLFIEMKRNRLLRCVFKRSCCKLGTATVWVEHSFCFRALGWKHRFGDFISLVFMHAVRSGIDMQHVISDFVVIMVGVYLLLLQLDYIPVTYLLLSVQISDWLLCACLAQQGLDLVLAVLIRDTTCSSLFNHLGHSARELVGMVAISGCGDLLAFEICLKLPNMSICLHFQLLGFFKDYWQIVVGGSVSICFRGLTC